MSDIITIVVMVVMVGGAVLSIIRHSTGIKRDQRRIQGILKDGILASAQVISLQHTGASLAIHGRRFLRLEMQLEVHPTSSRPHTAAPYRAQCSQLITEVLLPSMQPGAWIQVHVDRSKPQEVVAPGSPYAEQDVSGGLGKILLGVGVMMVAIVGLNMAVRYFDTPSFDDDEMPSFPTATEAKDRAPAAKEKTEDEDGDKRRLLKVADLTKVEPVEVVAQAVAFSKTVDADAKLVGAVFYEVKSGLLDLSGESRAIVSFEFLRKDPGKAPGKDVIKGSFRVMTRGSSIETVRSILPMVRYLRRPRTAGAFPIPVPQCCAKDAFKAAVRSGVPANSVTMLHLETAHPFSAAKVYKWRFAVEDHHEYGRSISTVNCSVLRR